MPTLVHNVAARIRQLRSKKGWSQEQLAEAAGLSRDAISRIERGDREPKLETLEEVSGALGVRAAELLELNAEVVIKRAKPGDVRLRSVARSFQRLEPWLADALADAVAAIARAQSRAVKGGAERPTASRGARGLRGRQQHRP